MALAVLGGVLTPEKPKFTALVFALGSVPQFGVSDMSPLSVILWPVRMLWVGLHKGSGWTSAAGDFFGALVAAAVMTGWMCLPYLPLVYAGYWIRRRCKSNK
jgi:hypothetical protein